jgi:hypothetical protein
MVRAGGQRRFDDARLRREIDDLLSCVAREQKVRAPRAKQAFIRFAIYTCGGPP